MSTDTRPTQPLPDPAAQWIAANPTSRSRRGRRGLRWVIALLVVGALAVGAWLLGEQIARGIVSGIVRDQVVRQLELPADQAIEVEIPGQILPQLIVGRLDELAISSDEVTLGAITGDVVVHATGVPTRGTADVASARAELTLDEKQLRTLLATMDGLPSDTVSLAPPNLSVSFDLTLLGFTVPVGVSLTPGAQDGDLVLTPSSVRIGGAEVPATAVAQQFGPIAGAVLRDWRVCVASYLPAGVTLTDVVVRPGVVSVGVAIDGGIIRDPALQRKGSCR